MASSAAARARRMPSSRSETIPCLRSSWAKEVSGRPYLVTGRVTSWLDSTQVGGAPIGVWVASVASITRRSADASHGQARKSKLNAVCSSSGRR